MARKRRRANLDPSTAYAKRRSAMISAAAEVFRAKGLSNTSFHDISGSIGVDRASIYYYFGSKEQLFQAVILESVESIVSHAKATCAGPGSARQRLTEIIRFVVSSFEGTYPSLHLFVQEDMRRLEDSGGDTVSAEAHRLAQLADQYMGMLEKLIEQGCSTSEFRDVQDCRVAALIIQGSINWMHRWFTPNDGLATAELSDQFITILLDGLAKAPSTDVPGTTDRPAACSGTSRHSSRTAGHNFTDSPAARRRHERDST